MTAPYFQDESVTLYHGDFREILPTLGLDIDLVVADPPYGETALVWDKWPDGWPSVVAEHARAMWCFGSMRMFLDRGHEFSEWRLSQDIVWRKHNGSGFTVDRFVRIHEFALHWYRGDWGGVHHDTPKVAGAARPSARIRQRKGPEHRGEIGAAGYEYGDTRLAQSVIEVRSEHGKAVNETQKPTGIVEPLISYGCPPRGLVVSVFAGSGTDLLAARSLGMRSVGFELRESQCEAAALRLSQGVLDLSGAGL